MTTTKQVILELISASGAQDLHQIMKECKEQSLESVTEEIVVGILNDLVLDRKLICQFVLADDVFPESHVVWGYASDF